MNEIITVQNVRGYIAADGTTFLNAEDVARGLGFTQTQNKGGKEYTSIRWETINRYLASFDFPQKVGENDFIPEQMFYLLAMKASNEAAKSFQMKIATDILPTLRKTGSYSVASANSIPTLLANVVTDIGETARALLKYIPGLKSGIALAIMLSLLPRLRILLSTTRR